MLQWIGEILIVLAGCGIGFSVSKELEEHLNNLNEIKKVFHLIKSEMQYTKAPFAEIFDKVGKKMSNPYKGWLLSVSKTLKQKQEKSFWDIWKHSIDEFLTDGRLMKEEIKELKEIGKQMEYPECLDLYIEQLEYRTKLLREDYKTKKKIYRSLGVMGGIFLAVILL